MKIIITSTNMVNNKYANYANLDCITNDCLKGVLALWGWIPPSTAFCTELQLATRYLDFVSYWLAPWVNDPTSFGRRQEE